MKASETRSMTNYDKTITSYRLAPEVAHRDIAIYANANQTSSPMEQRNSRVDQVRFLAACSVIVNHGLYTYRLPLVILAGRWTVPFFFMVSGYYYYQRFAQKSEYGFTQTIKPVLSILVVANGVYLLFVGLTAGSLNSLATHFTWLVGTYFHLWFLSAMFVAYLILWVFLYYKLESLLPCLAAVALGATFSLGTYHQLLRMPAHPLYARSLMAIPFLVIGFLVAKHKLEILLPKWLTYGLIPVGMGLQFLEASWLASYGPGWARFNFLGGTLLLSVGVLLMALQGPGSKANVLSECGRRFSVPLYLYHPMVYYGLSQVLATTMDSTLFYWLSPVLTLLILLSVFIVLERQCPKLFRSLSGQIKSAKPYPQPHMSSGQNPFS